MHVVHYRTENGIDIFQDWLDSLRDMKAKVAVLRRIDRLRSGNPGDHKACRDGVAELRCDVGPGYRVYYLRVLHKDCYCETLHLRSLLCRTVPSVLRAIL